MPSGNITCALSGVVPKQPVISPQGYIFEQTIIEPYLERHGNRCPLTKEDLLIKQLKEIKFTQVQIQQAPKPSGISNLIGVLQNDFDAAMGETFEIRKENEELRKELSANLYTEDAAIRILAALQRKNEALEAEVQMLKERTVAEVMASGGAGGAEAGGSASQMARRIPEDVASDLQALEGEFQEKRKETKNERKTAAENTLNPEKIAKFKCGAGNSIPMHSTTNPGVKHLVLRTDDENCVITGGKDGNVIVFDKLNKRLINTLKTNIRDPKPISALATNGDMIVAGCVDGSVHLFEVSESWRKGYSKTKSMKIHSKAVTGCGFHWSGKYFVTCSSDKSYIVHYTDGTAVYQHKAADPVEYTALAVHPGGANVALGTAQGSVSLGGFDEEEQAPVAVAISKQAVTSIDFHEGCLLMAAGTKDGVVKVYNAKKQSIVKDMQFPELSVTCVKFDATGKYLGVSLSDGALYVYEVGKGDYKLVASLAAHTEACSAFAFGFNAKFLASAGMDRHFKVWE